LLSERGRFLGEATVPGRLYDLGSYPGARPGLGIIVGEIFEIDESLIAALDEYEGSEFSRQIVSSSSDCWIYWYVGDAVGREIVSGDWFNR
jgi:gamma-glutamylcyclotransferase (GGCT)/AIG2-like uncharacterized protein YtfP